MSTFRTLVGLVALLIGSAPVAATPEDAEKAFESLYGQACRRAESSLDRSDDVALAERLVRDAKDPATAEALVRPLCEKAYDLTHELPAGYETAIAAVERLAEVDRNGAAACCRKRVDVRKRQYLAAKGLDRAGAGDTYIEALMDAARAAGRAGDYQQAVADCSQSLMVARAVKSHLRPRIQAASERFGARMRAERSVQAMIARVQQGAVDAATRTKLIETCLFDLDDPARAAAYVDDSCGAGLRKYALAAAKGIDAAPELACLEIADWYRASAGRVPKPSQAPILERARLYYERFLSLHAATDIKRSQAALALKQVQRRIEALVPALDPIGPGRWVDLIDLADLQKDALHGTWEPRGKGLRITPSPKMARLALPCHPTGDYQLKVTFTRLTGVNIVGIVLPVGRTHTVLMLSKQAGVFHGLTGTDASSAHREPGKLVNEKEYQVDVVVQTKGQQGQIRAELGGSPLLEWTGSWSALSAPAEFAPPDPGRVGLCTIHNIVDVKSVRIRMLSGVLELLH